MTTRISDQLKAFAVGLGFGDTISELLVDDSDQERIDACTTGLVITTWNRYEYLSKSFASLSKSRLDDCILVIVDDASNDPAIRQLILDADFGVPVIRVFKQQRCNVNTSLDIGWSLLHKLGCERLVNLDSDTLVKPDWLITLSNVFDQLQYPRDRLLLSGFNRHNNASIISDRGNYIVKSAMGGINYYFDAAMFETQIKPFLALPHWDSAVQEHFSSRHSSGYQMITTKPSVVQHIGVWGLNSDGKFDYAIDFDLDTEESTIPASLQQVGHEVQPLDESAKISCLITFRESGEGRLPALYYVASHLSHYPELQLVIVEQGSEPSIDTGLLPPNTIYKRVRNDGEFNKSWGINIAASLASGDILIAHDADMVLDLATLEESINQIRAGFVAVRPFDMHIDLSRSETEALLRGDKNIEISRSEGELSRRNKGHLPPFCGGIFVIRNDFFREIGGMDERFRGWGAEDDAMSLRVFNQSTKIQTLEQSMAYHLWHESDQAVVEKEPASYIRNLALLTAYYEQGKDLLEAFKNDTVQNACLEKYDLKETPIPSNSLPLISCLCITRQRVSYLQRAIQCYRNQTYLNKELLIICDEDDAQTRDFVEALDDADISLHIASQEESGNLGKLRNLAIRLSAGDYFCQWDDDDWYHPSRLSKQFSFCQEQGKAASILPSWCIYSGVKDKAYLSNIRLWEGSVLCRRDAFEQPTIYAETKRGEEAPMIRHLVLTNELAIINDPKLYFYWHGEDNTWGAAHFTKIFNASRLLLENDTKLIREKFIATRPKVADSLIPKIIHQTAKSAALSPKYEQWQKDLIAMHEDWDYRFYDDSDCRRVISDNMPELLPCYDSLPLNIQRVDLFRLVAVYLFGGFYIDFDVVFKKSLMSLREHQCVLAEEVVLNETQCEELKHEHPQRIANYMFGAKPRDPFIAQLIRHVSQNAAQQPIESENDVLASTGPAMVTEQFHNYYSKDQITVLENKEHVCKTCDRISCAFGDYAMHLHQGSWRWDHGDSTVARSRSIHQTWKDTDIPAELRECVKSWSANHPKWQQHLWTDEDNRNLIATHYPWFLDAYDNYPHNIQRADAARYFILYSVGGLYVDLDFKSLKAIDPLIDDVELALGYENPEHSNFHAKKNIIGNAFIYAAQAGHPFLRAVIEELAAPIVESKNANDHVLETTGPFMLTRVFERYDDKSSITILPAELLYPVDYLKAEELLANQAQDDKFIQDTDAFAIHYHYGSWWKK